MLLADILKQLGVETASATDAKSFLATVPASRFIGYMIKRGKEALSSCDLDPAAGHRSGGCMRTRGTIDLGVSKMSTGTHQTRALYAHVHRSW